MKWDCPTILCWRRARKKPMVCNLTVHIYFFNTKQKTYESRDTDSICLLVVACRLQTLLNLTVDLSRQTLCPLGYTHGFCGCFFSSLSPTSSYGLWSSECPLCVGCEYILFYKQLICCRLRIVKENGRVPTVNNQRTSSIRCLTGSSKCELRERRD